MALKAPEVQEQPKPAKKKDIWGDEDSDEDNSDPGFAIEDGQQEVNQPPQEVNAAAA